MNKQNKGTYTFFSIFPPSAFILIVGALINRNNSLSVLLYFLTTEAFNLTISTIVIFIVTKLTKISLRVRSVFGYALIITIITDIYSFISSFYLLSLRDKYFSSNQISVSLQFNILFFQSIIPGILTFILLFILLRRFPFRQTLIASLIISFLTLPWATILPIQQIEQSLNTTINTGRIKNYKGSISKEHPAQTINLSFDYPATYRVHDDGSYELRFSRRASRDFVITSMQRSYYGYEPYNPTKSIQEWYKSILEKTFNYPAVDFSRMTMEEITINNKKYLKIMNPPSGNSYSPYNEDIFYIPFANPEVFIDQMSMEKINIIMKEEDVNTILSSLSFN